MRVWAVALALSLCASSAAQADLWSGFYKRSAPEAAEASDISATDLVCLQEIQAAEARYSIPDHLLLAIGIQEAGRTVAQSLTVWPWTLNVKGKGMFFVDRDEMLDHYKSLHRQGVRSIDVGCMQVNQKWHGRWFGSVDQAADPFENVDYAARYLVALFHEEGDWWRAAGRYHSSTPQYRDIYLAKLAKNQRVARAFSQQLRTLVARQDRSASDVQSADRGVFWSSTLIAEADTQRRYSIYSNTPMQPVLPGYEDAN